MADFEVSTGAALPSGLQAGDRIPVARLVAGAWTPFEADYSLFQNVLVGYAPIANPVFTGSVTVASWSNAPSTNAGVIGYNTALTRYEFGVGGSVVSFLPLGGGTLTGPITLSGAPTQNLHPATKLYVDAAVGGAAPGYPAGRVITSSANVQLLATDSLVAFSRTSSPANTLVTMPAVPPNWPVTIKDMAGNAATYPITLQSASGTMEGGATLVINQNKGSLTVQWNGAEWSEI